MKTIEDVSRSLVGSEFELMEDKNPIPVFLKESTPPLAAIAKKSGKVLAIQIIALAALVAIITWRSSGLGAHTHELTSVRTIYR